MAPLTALLFAASLLAAPAAAAPLVLCMDEQPHPPYILAEGGGSIPALIREAGRLAGVDVQIYQAPLLRCWEEMRNGKAHGYTSSSPIADPSLEFRYPMVDGKFDTSRATALARLMVFLRKGDVQQWDGRHFDGVRRPALLPSGMLGVAGIVHKLGVQTDLQAKSVEQNFAKLLARRGDVAIAYENDGRELLRQARFAGHIDMAPAPLRDIHYYMIVTQRAYDNERVMVDAMWQAIGTLNARRAR